VRKTSLAAAKSFDALAAQADGAVAREQYEQLAAGQRALAKSVPPEEARRPVTLGVGEPFTATVRVAAYAAFLIALPLILFQAYAFILPAFSREERGVALPLMVMVPFLFLAGVVFGYYMVLPNAVNFLQNFNDDNYDILLQARDYYKFAITLLIAMGVAFQVPVGILAITRVGIVSVAQLRKNRRYAILVVAVLAMLLPGQDPVTMLSLMIPLYVLYEGSILLASLLDRRAARKEAVERESSEDPEP
jgi:sec-independent protein translocase protein TatC